MACQAVLCLPPLKAHYLAGGHAAAACAARRAARGGDAAAAAPCLSCELDAAFAAAFARPRAAAPAPRAPWSPAALLAAWWRHAEALASYQQQDAHEFFLSLVAGVHAATAPRGAGASGLRSPMSPGLGSPRFNGGGWCADADCGCAAHRAFAGRLRSDVVCGRCGGVSTAIDPFVDISLELPPAEAEQRSSGGESADCAPGGDGSSATSLGACLRRFTRAELLGAAERVACAACGSPQPGSSKQLSFASAPPALCLHLKRFAHAGGAGAARAAKLDAHVSFPLDCLDLAPFLAAARLHARAGHRLRPDADAHAEASASAPDAAPAPPPPCRYWLAAAVCHAGGLEGGHYVAYVRHGGAWYCCDDAWVRAVAPAEVAAARAYLLFYAAHAATAGGTA